ncbi:MAG: hypothetical protein ACE5IQ_12250 [Candidatus Methylomirabilales bacterium]
MIGNRKRRASLSGIFLLILLVGLPILFAGGALYGQQAGIASKYPGDKGIENDPDVIFVENFEEGSLASVRSRWDNVKNPRIMSLSTDVPPGSASTHSLLMTHVGGRGTGGHLYRRLLPGYERLFARFYVKFDSKSYGIHHFGTNLGGNNPPTRWPVVRAGYKPPGDKQFWVGAEPHGPAWRWDFYTYWMKMRTNPDKRFWGNDFINDRNFKVTRGTWISVELMISMNDPVSASNGELALWIDGKPRIKDGQVISHFGKGFPRGRWVWDSFLPDPTGKPFEGFQWRTVKKLNVNYVWAYLYITKAPRGHVSRVWFDDIVVAKKYIGPIRRAK